MHVDQPAISNMKAVKQTSDIPDQKKASEHQTRPDLVPYDNAIIKTPRPDLPKQKNLKEHNTAPAIVDIPKPKPAPVVKQRKPKMTAPVIRAKSPEIRAPKLRAPKMTAPAISTPVLPRYVAPVIAVPKV